MIVSSNEEVSTEPDATADAAARTIPATATFGHATPFTDVPAEFESSDGEAEEIWRLRLGCRSLRGREERTEEEPRLRKEVLEIIIVSMALLSLNSLRGQILPSSLALGLEGLASLSLALLLSPLLQRLEHIVPDGPVHCR